MRIVAVTACTEGIAYTYIAAEALRKAAYDKGVDLIIEKHVALGIEGALTKDEIASSDGVIIAADETLDLTRFKGKKIVEATTADAIKDASLLFDRLLEDI